MIIVTLAIFTKRERGRQAAPVQKTGRLTTR